MFEDQCDLDGKDSEIISKIGPERISNLAQRMLSEQYGYRQRHLRHYSEEHQNILSSAARDPQFAWENRTFIEDLRRKDLGEILETSLFAPKMFNAEINMKLANKILLLNPNLDDETKQLFQKASIDEEASKTVPYLIAANPELTLIDGGKIQKPLKRVESTGTRKRLDEIKYDNDLNMKGSAWDEYLKTLVPHMPKMPKKVSIWEKVNIFERIKSWYKNRKVNKITKLQNKLNKAVKEYVEEMPFEQLRDIWKEKMTDSIYDPKAIEDLRKNGIDIDCNDTKLDYKIIDNEGKRS